MRTIVIIDENGRLIDVTGAMQEDVDRYQKFSKRLLNSNGSTAILNYGWNGNEKLTIAKDGAQGDSIFLDAKEVQISGGLKVGTKSLQTIIDESTDLAINGIIGTQSEIDVDITDNSGENVPRKICTISLSPDFINRVDSLEAKMSALFKFEEVYTFGDGLELTKENYNQLRVKIEGPGLQFIDTISESTEDNENTEDAPEGEDTDTPVYTKALALELAQRVDQSDLPITARAVYSALEAIGAVALLYSIAPNTNGNYCIFENSFDGSSSSDSLEEES